MKSNRLISKALLNVTLLIFLQIIFQANVYAREYVPKAFIQVGVGLALDVFSSSDIDAVLETGDSIDGIGLQLSGQLHLGISNIIALEYQQRLAGGSHDVKNNTTTGADLSMDYEYELLLLKLNPFPGGYTDDSEPFYLVYGTAQFDYFGAKDYCWQGEGTVYGLEWTIMEYRLAYRYGLKYIRPKLNRCDIAGTPPDKTNFNSEVFMMDISISFGM